MPDDEEKAGADASLSAAAEDPRKHRIKNASIFNFVYPKHVTDKYKLLDAIGRGTFGLVRKCQLIETGEEFALKAILKKKVPDVELLKTEITILLEVDHPHIIKLYDVYEDIDNVYLVTELCTGGELYDRVVEKTNSPEGHFSEFCAARIIRNILSGIRYCHEEKDIVHRDLKPENFLLTDSTDDAKVKIIDFGLSTHAKISSVMHDQVGTIYYVAPEVLSGSYNEKADIWSIGVVAYVMLCGYPPFNGGTEFLTWDLVKAGDVIFPSASWDHISEEAICFIKRLLEFNPDKRPSASEALQDPWLNQKKVQPLGLAWASSFIPKLSRLASDVEDARDVKHLDHEKKSIFAGFLMKRKSEKELC
ncbi:unnamed protein product [Pseudo-nitzschia multistriata]|uniref:non-specific serine/threonine protein kinase n=1 Tax=Pseudo-nitzschia multistriata TaxID=183589 RepID=A0A448Z1S0_9STRA|nr:unnamed protein product [Pseudo-nitzschia multistriata]